MLYKHYDINKDKKEDIINKSIKDFLEKYSDKLDIDWLSEKINTSQKNKYYVMWCEREFYVDKIVDMDQDNNIINWTKNTIIIDNLNGKGRYKLLLRWKNRLGILNPAWQISYSE
jgi:hypothetical protein